MILTHELDAVRIHPTLKALLFMAANLVEQGATVTVSLSAPKVTDAPARRPDVDFVPASESLPRDLHVGALEVHRYVDNPKNRREDRVGHLFFKVRDVLRADGFRPFGWVSVRPADITSFKVLGFYTPKPEAEMTTVALAPAAEAEAQSPNKGA
jgi:hypothetical protein